MVVAGHSAHPGVAVPHVTVEEEAVQENVAPVLALRHFDAVGEEALPEPPTDEEVEEAAEALGAPQAEVDSLPLDGE